MFEFSTFISSHIIYNFSSVFPQCMHFLTLNKSRQCKFIKTQLTCQMSDGFFQYLQFPYCQLSSVPEVAFILLVSVSSWLCTCILSCLLGGGYLTNVWIWGYYPSFSTGKPKSLGSPNLLTLYFGIVKPGMPVTCPAFSSGNAPNKWLKALWELRGVARCQLGSGGVKSWGGGYSHVNTGRLVLQKKTVFSTWASMLNMGLINKGWYGIVSCLWDMVF